MTITSGENGLPDGELDAICRRRGGRMTRQRHAVLTKLLAARSPLSAYDLLDQLRLADSSATPAGVYRCLDFLLKVGLAHRLETTRSFIACEHPDRPHDVQFLICRQCGAVIEVEDVMFATAAETLGRRFGFALDRQIIEIKGLCATCKDQHARSQ